MIEKKEKKKDELCDEARDKVEGGQVGVDQSQRIWVDL